MMSHPGRKERSHCTRRFYSLSIYNVQIMCRLYGFPMSNVQICKSEPKM